MAFKGHDMTQPQFTPPSLQVREDGYECLTFHRGKWTHVRWTNHGWSLGYGGPFITELDRKFAPLPPKPDGADGFYDWK